MPNYLVKSSGRPEPSILAGSDKSNSVYVDDIYKTWLYNEDKTVMFIGKLPEEFQLGLSGNWGAGFDRALTAIMGGGAQQTIESSAQFLGLSTRTKILTARTWEQPGYLDISMPISLYAYDTTTGDVLNPMKEMLKLCAPAMKDGMLTSPGPTPLKTMMDSTGTVDASSLNGEILTFQIGKWFKMCPCVVQSVTESVEGIMEHETGNPMSVSVTMEISSYFAVTKDDIDKWIKSDSFGAPS